MNSCCYWIYGRKTARKKVSRYIFQPGELENCTQDHLTLHFSTRGTRKLHARSSHVTFFYSDNAKTARKIISRYIFYSDNTKTARKISCMHMHCALVALMLNKFERHFLVE